MDTIYLIKKEERGKRGNKGKKKRSWRHIENLMTTTLVMLERYRRDESNDTKKDYEQ
jgi:hypothetical protein